MITMNVNPNPVQVEPAVASPSHQSSSPGEFAKLIADNTQPIDSATTPDESVDSPNEALKGLLGVVEENQRLDSAEQADDVAVTDGEEDSIGGVDESEEVNEIEAPEEETPAETQLWTDLRLILAPGSQPSQPDMEELPETQDEAYVPVIEEQEEAKNIADILEGMKQTDKDVVPLLDTLRDAAVGSDRELRKTVVARMPEIVERLDESPENETARRVADVFRGYLCSLENAGEDGANTADTDTAPVDAASVNTAPPVKESHLEFAARPIQSEAFLRPPGTTVVHSPHPDAPREEYRPFTGVGPEMASAFQTPMTPESLPVEAIVDGHPIPFEEAVMNMIEEITTSQLPAEGKDFEIVLKPEYLGKLVVNVTMTENGLTAQIRTDDLNVRGMLSQQMHHLVESLQEKGIEVSNVDVVYAQTDQFGENTPSQSGQYDQQDNNRRSIVAASIPIQPDEDYGLMSSFSSDEPISSVEFTA